MSFRRRKGLGREKTGGDSPGEPRGRRRGGEEEGAVGPLRRWALLAGVALAAAGAGYLVAAEVLFPAPSPAETGALTPVPDLRGAPLEEARGRLQEAGFSLRVSSRVPVADAEEGRVLAQRPLGGQLAPPGDTVSLTVADAAGPVRLPPLRSLREAEALRILDRMGLRVATTREAASVPRGEVVRTVPAAGETAEPGTRVQVVLSEGPPVAAVPQLVGRHIDDVRSILAGSGLELGAVRYDTAAFAAPGRVVGQSPPAGFSLRAGERVGVRVAGRPPAAPAGASGGLSGDTARGR